MKKVFCFSILLSMISSAVFSQEKIITVMTYNIYHGEMAYQRGKSNLAEIARVINKYQPDFVALQEVDSLTGRSAALNQGQAQNLVKALASLTGMQGYFGKAMDYDGGGYGEGLLSRHPASASNHLLPNPEGGEPRALLTVRAEVPGIGAMIFAGTHLCHQFEENKVAQATAITDLLGDSELPVLMGGDFNFEPESAPYKIVAGSFADAAKVMGDPKYTISYQKPRARIDYIFFSPDRWEVKDVTVLHEGASDHMPVLVKLSLKE